MNRPRWALLLLGPLPILVGSLWVTRTVKPQAREAITENQVLPQAEGLASYSARDGQEQAARPGAARAPSEPGAARAQVSTVESFEPGEELSAQCERTRRRLAARLGPECSALIREPFVVAGDSSLEELASWHRQTIAPAAQALDRSYFERTPDEPITVLLFRSAESYQHYAEQLFGDRDMSVYGYYKPRERTLVMNIATGGGTLVHELTHALIDFDFPAVPDWFNEGLASLHEQCRFRADGSGIEGLVNWRLPTLQHALRDGQLRPLESLLADDDFRGPQEPLNYAQARYLCLYLQEQGTLAVFYARFRAAQGGDPQGRETLRQLVAPKSLAEFDAEFRAWVSRLEPLP